MRVVNAYWAKRCNILIIRCRCGHEFKHPANRVRMICPLCKEEANAHEVKKKGVDG